MKSLYDPSELVGTPAFLRGKFGVDRPEPHQMESWRLAEVRQFHSSPIFAIRNYFRTADKASNLVAIQPFAGQAILDVCIESQRRKGYPQRVVGVKSRQVGWSTWSLGRMLHNSMKRNRRGMFLVPDEDVAAVMATRMGTMVNSLPLFLQPMRRIDNVKHVVFDNPNRKDRIDNPGLASEMQIVVPSPMRGIPPQFLVVSEYSHMDSESQYEVSSSIIPAIPLTENTCVIIDTTPNGFDDFYHPLVMDAMEANPKWCARLEHSKRPYTAEQILAGELGEPDRPDAGYVIAFEPWHWHEEYDLHSAENPRGELRKPPKDVWREFLDNIGKNPRYGGEEEIYQREEFGVSDGRLFWRRRKIDSYRMPTQEMQLGIFHQEFATTIEGAFISSGETPFDTDALNALMRMEKPPSARGILETNHDGVIGVNTHSKSEFHEVRIYAPPQSGEKYALAVDTNIAYTNQESDQSAAVVVRARDQKVAATYTARVSEPVLRLQIFLLYRWYFNAYYAVELKGQGFNLQRALIEMGARNVYYWKREDVDPAEFTQSKYPGWETNGRTRPLMDGVLLETICYRDPNTNKPMPQSVVQDKQLLRQLQDLSWTNTGSLKSRNGHDDLVDAYAIALLLLRDPFSGLTKRTESESAKEKRELEESIARWSGKPIRDRNHPDLAYL